MNRETMIADASPHNMMWTVGLLDYPFEERVRAVAEQGYHAMSANAWELEDVLVADGIEGIRALRKVADDHGIRLRALEPVTAWLPASGSAFLRRVELEVIELIGVEMGVEALLAAGYPPPGYSFGEIARDFGALCELADRHGWTPALEFTPNSGIASLAAARRVIEECGHDSARLVFDAWHFFRGDPDFDVLESTPGAMISFVQLDDADEQVVGPLTDDTRNRKLPGHGDLDLVRVLKSLDRIGGLTSVGPEIFRPVQAGQSCHDAVREMAESTDLMLTEADVLRAP